MPGGEHKGEDEGPADGTEYDQADGEDAHGAEPVRQPLAGPFHLAELLGHQPSHGRLFLGLLRHLVVTDLPVEIRESARVGAHGSGGPAALHGQDRDGDPGVESAMEHPGSWVLVSAEQGRDTQSQEEHQDRLCGQTAVE
ncbi:hypothetical protein LUX34_33250 [Streptomyces werraensis]|nr:hypothetical protein [Streptomyces werraensis]